MSIANAAAIVRRGFLLALLTAVGSLVSELIFVYGMKLFGHSVSFTSFFAAAMFCGLAGFIPTQPSPSRLSSAPIGIVGRVLLVIEITAAVAAATFASSRFMAYRHIIAPVEIWFAAYAYVLILTITLIANFGRLRREISAPN